MLLVSVAIVLAGCSSSKVVAGHQAASGSTSTDQSSGAAPEISVQPNDGSTDVALNAVVTVEATGGMLDSVVVHPNNDPSAIAGTLASDQQSWKSSAALDPGVSYVVDASAHTSHGDAATIRAAFTTTKVRARLTTDTFPADGDVVGVGMPIRLRFNNSISPDRQAKLVQQVQVTSTPPVDGAWHWFSPYEAHWRPRDLWPVNTKVTVNAHLRGFDAGNGIWGLGDWTSNFTISPDKHVALLDNNTHQMQVFNNDQLVYTWPISMGRPNRPTLEGTLVVWYHQQDVLMDSRTIGIPRESPDGYYEHVHWNTAISTDGFFIHSAPWSVWAQGYRNVSHGCVNLSPDRATTFYNFSRPGDVVQVKNTGRPADASDGEGDWQIPFDQYANSGGAATPPPTPSQPGGL
jgi:lipoprotein-anchoring transpeptidase ErfK/SrfK